MIQEVKAKFVEEFSSKPRTFRSPGRINIIGEHTDYNEGFVLPAAIDKQIVFAIAPNTCGKFRFCAKDLNEYGEFPYVVEVSQTWANYLLGVIAQIQKRGVQVPPVDVVFGGNVPLGAGLSSSAALECGFAYALNEIFNFGFSRLELVQMSQMAEHEFAHVNCGIMDQFAVMFGKKDHVIQLDCKTLEYQYFPLELHDYTILLCNSNVKHELVSSEYNVRRRETEAGVQVVASHFPNIHTMRDVTMEQLLQCAPEMQGKSFNRCKYVIEENIRLKRACQAMTEGDIKTVGAMMYGTHEGMSKLYEASCPEIDVMVEIAKTCDGVVGSRIMGGGFGGCTISLVQNDAVELFKKRIIAEYYQKYDKTPTIYEVAICDGTSEL